MTRHTLRSLAANPGAFGSMESAHDERLLNAHLDEEPDRPVRDAFSAQAILVRGGPIRERLLDEHAAGWSSQETVDKVAALDDGGLLCLTVACWASALRRGRDGLDDAADLWLAGVCEREQLARAGRGEQAA